MERSITPCDCEAKSQCYDRASLESYLKNNYGVEVPRNTNKTISFRHPAVDKPIRGTKLGSDYTADSIYKALQENQERSLYNARLFATENAKQTHQQPTTATTKPNKPVGRYEPTAEDENRERPIARSVSHVNRELREIDTTIQSLARRNQKNATADRTKSADGQQEVRNTDSIIADSSKSNIDLRPDVTVKPRKKSIGYDR